MNRKKIPKWIKISLLSGRNFVFPHFQYFRKLTLDVLTLLLQQPRDNISGAGANHTVSLNFWPGIWCPPEVGAQGCSPLKQPKADPICQCFSNFQISRSPLNSYRLVWVHLEPSKVQTKEPTEPLESTLRTTAIHHHTSALF